jgi:peroxiredoxin
MPHRTFIGLLFFLLAACGGEQAAKLNLGDPAPAFRTQRLDGASVDFPGAAAGRPLVIRFWADWCKYCEPEMKAIEAVYRRHKDKGLEVFAINAGQERAAVAAFIGKLGVTYPVLLDESASIARRYGVVGLPTTYFVDAKGVVRGKVIGEADEAVFERHALELLK